jgi:glutamate racemase
MSNSPIGVFDSGVGGLSILHEIHRLLPNEDMLYFADQAHVPYGHRTLDEVRGLSVGITRYLLDHDAKLIVVACNTASAAALGHLRSIFPGVPFVGMEPAVKPAAATTRSGQIGVLATPATFEGELFASVVARFASDVGVHQRTVPGLVERIEAGDLSGAETRTLLETALAPLLEAGIDTLVLGCTHYPFVVPLLEQLAGPSVRVIDPAPAVARQVQRRLEAGRLSADPSHGGRTTYMTSGDPMLLAPVVHDLIGLPGEMHGVVWRADRPVDASP